jgi:hypothetical protein
VKKETKSLSGASQDAYFTRVLKADPNLTTEGRERIVRHLREEIAQVRLRVNAPRDIAASTYVPLETAPRSVEANSQRASANAEQPFDPYTPNVVVVVRKFGSETAIAALGAIDSIEDLRYLAREQRLWKGASCRPQRYVSRSSGLPSAGLPTVWRLQVEI